MALLLPTSKVTVTHPQAMLRQKPLLYEGQIQFVDPIIRQTLPDAMPQNCSDLVRNLFQMDLDQKDSWYSLTPEITQPDRLAVFPSKEISSSLRKSFPSLRNVECTLPYFSS